MRKAKDAFTKEVEEKVSGPSVPLFVIGPRLIEIEPFYVVVLAILLATVLIGTTYSLLYSTSNETLFRTRFPARKLSDSLSPVIPTYFADKQNFFNQFFVKKSWGWTSLACLAHYIATHSDPSRAARRKPAEIKPILRWLIATVFWIAFARWLFGHSLSHRILTATGAQCIPAHIESQSTTMSMPFDPAPCLPGFGTGSSPWSAKGVQFDLTPDHKVSALPKVGPWYWKGGHDISGHTFVLIHASLLLLVTISPTIPRIFPLLRSWFRRSSAFETVSTQLKITTFLIMALVGLWWWMLLITSAFFHSPQEKFTGFIFGVAGWMSYSATIP